MNRAIEKRRSIRRYQERAVPKTMIREIIQAGILPLPLEQTTLAVYCSGGRIKERSALGPMRSGIEREKKEPLLPGSKQYRKGAEYTLKIMEQAPVMIFCKI